MGWGYFWDFKSKVNVLHEYLKTPSLCPLLFPTLNSPAPPTSILGKIQIFGKNFLLRHDSVETKIASDSFSSSQNNFSVLDVPEPLYDLSESFD